MKMMSEEEAASEQFVRGFHQIPEDEKLRTMPFVLLAELLSSCELGSAKFKVVEREMSRRAAKDQAKINRSNILLGACIGGIFGLAGVVLGVYLKDLTATQTVSSPAAMQEVQSDSAMPKGEPPARQSGGSPAPVQSNGQPSRS